MNYIGDYVEDDVVYLMFNTFSSDDPSASCTITNFINTDVHIHKDDGLTQRNNAAGITVSVDFDGITGSHMIKIDTSDETVVGFWVTGHDYFVRIEGTTVDAATINAMVGSFSIENRYMRGTNSANTTVPDAAGVAPTVTEIRQEIDSNSTRLDADISSRAPASEYDTEMAHLDVDVSSRNATTPPTVTAIRTEMDTNSTKMAPSQTLADYKATGFNTVVPDAAGVAPTVTEIRQEIDANSTRLDVDVSSRSTVTTAQVNAEVVDVVRTDVTTEMGQGAPPATPTMEEMMAYIYFRLRNKCTTTADEDAMWDNAGTTKLVKATITDDGTTLTKGEYVSGA